MRRISVALGLSMAAAFSTVAFSQSSPRKIAPVVERLQRGDINSGTIGIVSGSISGTYVRIAADLASVLDDGDKLRILPIVGKGSIQNLRDLLYLRGIDLALVQSDVVEAFRREGIQNIDSQVRYVAKLYNEEGHLIASNNIRDVNSLNGKKVNIDVIGSGTAMTARIIFERLGVQPEFTNFEQNVAYEKLKNGEIDAAWFIAGKPVRGIVDFKAEDRFHFVTIPYNEKLQEVYLPAQLQSSDYPNLIPPGKSVDTIAVGTVLAAFNWASNTDRYDRLRRFTDTFFSRFEEFQRAPRHPKWQEVNIAANIPGWTRFPAAEEWLKEHRNDTTATATAQNFGRFLSETNSGNATSDKERERLFKEFLQWQRRKR